MLPHAGFPVKSPKNSLKNTDLIQWAVIFRYNIQKHKWSTPTNETSKRNLLPLTLSRSLSTGHSGGSSGGHSSTGRSSRTSHSTIRSGNRVWIGGRSGSVLSFVLFTGGILGVTFLKRKRQQHVLAQTDRNDVLIAMSGSEQ